MRRPHETRPLVQYLDGWYAEEHDGVRPFRWMAGSGRCRVERPGVTGAGWIRLTGGLGRSVGVSPVLSAWINGRMVGQTRPATEVGHHVFPAELTDQLDVVFTIDSTCAIAGDPRELGLMVRGVEVFGGQEDTSAVDAEGWYDWEHDNYFPFRWMSHEARLILPGPLVQRGRFGALPVFSPFEIGTQILSISRPGHDPLRLSLRPGWHVYDFALAGAGTESSGPEASELRFTVVPVFPADRHPDDGRELGVAIGAFDVHDDRRRHDWVRGFLEGMSSPATEGRLPVPRDVASSSDFTMLPGEGDGWYDLESDDEGPFRWMGREARARVPDAGGSARFCVVRVFSTYHNLKQELTVLAGDHVLATWALLKRWNSYCLALPAISGPGGLTLTFRVNSLVPAASHVGDSRDLGVRVGVLRFHDAPVRHEFDASRQKNNELRQREVLAGATVLASTPSTLGIDLFGKCNIKPACVYCPWDRMKALEGPNADVVIDDRTLESYGPLFSGAQSLVNCSFGEPLLHPRLEQVLDLVARHGQTIELATNGQAFTARTVQALAGAPVFLYVSLDAASASMYARLRNERWHEIIAGLLALREARQRAGGWPRLNMVFIPMRANKDDLEDYFKLCRLVDADSLVLRPLLMEESQVDTERGGYRFVYEREHLGQDDLTRLVARCHALASRYGVRVMTQFDFGKVDFGVLDAAAGRPD